MGLIILLVVGGVIGWLASLIMRTDAQQGLVLNVVVGIVGALIASVLFGGSILNGGFTFTRAIASLVGAVILLAIVNWFRRGAVR